jgi:hypothetical protein
MRQHVLSKIPISQMSRRRKDLFYIWHKLCCWKDLIIYKARKRDIVSLVTVIMPPVEMMRNSITGCSLQVMSCNTPCVCSVMVLKFKKERKKKKKRNSQVHFPSNEK